LNSLVNSGERIALTQGGKPNVIKLKKYGNFCPGWELSHEYHVA